MGHAEEKENCVGSKVCLLHITVKAADHPSVLSLSVLRHTERKLLEVLCSEGCSQGGSPGWVTEDQGQPRLPGMPFISIFTNIHMYTEGRRSREKEA